MIKKLFAPAPDQGGAAGAVADPPLNPPEPYNPQHTPPGSDPDSHRDSLLEKQFGINPDKVPAAEPTPKSEPVPSSIPKPEAAPQKDEPKPEPTAAPKPDAAKPEDSETLKKLDATPAPKSFDPNKQSKIDQDFTGMKKKYGDYARQLEQQLREVTAKTTTQLGDLTAKIKTLQTENEQLKGFKLAIDYQADPKFLEEHENPVNEKRTEICDYLKSVGVDQGSIDALKNVWGDEYQMRIVEKKLRAQDETVADIFKDHYTELRGLQRKRDRAVQEATTNRDKIIQERRQALSQKDAERETGFKNRIDHVLKMTVGEGANATPKWGFLKSIDVPSNATPEQRAEIEAHNARAANELQEVQALARSEAPEDRIDMAVLSRFVPVLVERFNVLHEAYTDLKGKWDKVAKSGGFSEKPSGTPKSTVKTEPKIDASMDGGEAIDRLFNVG